MKTFDEAVHEVIGKRVTRDPVKLEENVTEYATRYFYPMQNEQLEKSISNVITSAVQSLLSGMDLVDTLTHVYVGAFRLGIAIGTEMEKGETVEELVKNKNKM